MIIEIIEDNKYYNHFIDIINILDIKDCILLLSINDETITLFTEDLKHNYNRISNLNEYFTIIDSGECGLTHNNINYYDINYLKYQVIIDKYRNKKINDLLSQKN